MQPRNIPGFAEVVDWPTVPSRPLQVIHAEQWRFQGVPAWVIMADSDGSLFVFGFDSFLGRLFHGAPHESESTAAWVRLGSPLEAEVFSILRRDADDPRWPWLAPYVERAAFWSQTNRTASAAG